jgi:hypothetical protein
VFGFASANAVIFRVAALGFPFGLRVQRSIFRFQRALWPETTGTPRIEFLFDRTPALQLEQVEAMVEETVERANDPANSLVFAHFPVPHPPIAPGLPDDSIGRSLARDSYLYNLAIVDLVLERIRDGMTQAGTWDSTSIVITSDHGMRGTDHGRSVPLMIRVAGGSGGDVFEEPVETVVLAELVLAILRGEVGSDEAVREWFVDRLETSGASRVATTWPQ